MEIKIGSKIYFPEEKAPFKVKAMDERYIICTKPYNFKRTVFYTIIDMEQNIRGANNMIFNPYDYMVQEDIEQCLKDLQSKEVEISYRNRVSLSILKIE